MALDDSTPWLHPPNFLGAMEGGARLGLSARGEQREETGAADRLRLAYDQLAAQEKRASELVKSRQQIASASLALRAQQASALEQYRRDQIEERRKAESDKAHHYFHNSDGTVTHLNSATGSIESLGTPRPKPTPAGSLTVDAVTGDTLQAHGSPDSLAVMDVRKKAAERKASDALKELEPNILQKAWGKLTGAKTAAGPSKKFKIVAVDGKPVDSTPEQTDDSEE
jgi:hypothetical protein